MARTIVSPPRPAAADSTPRPGAHRPLLACGILAPLLYAAMTVVVGAQWPGYDAASRVISELSAVGAPTRGLWSLLSIPYTILILAFGVGVWKAAGDNRPLRRVGLLMLASTALGAVVWPFAPMHSREALAAGGGTWSDTVHVMMGAVTVLLMLAMMASGSHAFGRPFRLYTLVSIAVLLAFGFLTFLDAPRVSANRPTPLIGLWERVNIGVFMLWQAVLAARLLRGGYVASASGPRRTGRYQHAGA